MSPRDRAFLDRLHQVVVRRQQQAAGSHGKPGEKDRWAIDGSVVIGRIDTAERRVYVGTQHIATPDDGVLVEDSHAPDVRRLWHHTSALHPDEVLLKRKLHVEGWRIVGAETVFDFRDPAHADPDDRDDDAAEVAAVEEVVVAAVVGTAPAAATASTAATPTRVAEEDAAVPEIVVDSADAADATTGDGSAEDVAVAAAAPRVAELREQQAAVADRLAGAAAAVAAGHAIPLETLAAVQQWNADVAALAVAVGLPPESELDDIDVAVRSAVERLDRHRREEISEGISLLDGLIDRFPFASDALAQARAVMVAAYER